MTEVQDSDELLLFLHDKLGAPPEDLKPEVAKLHAMFIYKLSALSEYTENDLAGRVHESIIKALSSQLKPSPAGAKMAEQPVATGDEVGAIAELTVVATDNKVVVTPAVDAKFQAAQAERLKYMMIFICTLLIAMIFLPLFLVNVVNCGGVFMDCPPGQCYRGSCRSDGAACGNAQRMTEGCYVNFYPDTTYVGPATSRFDGSWIAYLLLFLLCCCGCVFGGARLVIVAQATASSFPNAQNID